MPSFVCSRLAPKLNCTWTIGKKKREKKRETHETLWEKRPPATPCMNQPGGGEYHSSLRQLNPAQSRCMSSDLSLSVVVDYLFYFYFLFLQHPKNRETLLPSSCRRRIKYHIIIARFLHHPPPILPGPPTNIALFAHIIPQLKLPPKIVHNC